MRRLYQIAFVVSLIGSSVHALAKPLDIAQGLSDLQTTSSGHDFLHVDQAFKVALTRIGPREWRGEFTVAPDYYLYRSKISVSAVGPSRVGVVELPSGETHEDPYFGKSQIFRQRVLFNGTIVDDPPAGPVDLLVGYQGCADKGICYPPVTKTVRLDFSEPATPITLARRWVLWLALLVMGLPAMACLFAIGRRRAKETNAE